MKVTENEAENKSLAEFELKKAKRIKRGRGVYKGDRFFQRSERRMLVGYA